VSPKATTPVLTDFDDIRDKTFTIADLVYARAGKIAEKRGGDAKQPGQQDYDEAWEACIRDELDALVGTKNAQEDITRTIETAKKENNKYEALAVRLAWFYGVSAIYLIVIIPFIPVWLVGDSTKFVGVICGLLANTVLLAPLRYISRCRRYNIELDLFGHLVKTTNDKKTMLQVLKQLSKSLIESDKK